MEVRVSQDEKWNEALPIKISKEVDFIDIREVSRAMCLKKG